MVGVLFVLSPRLLYGWRNLLLRCFGARIGSRVQIYPSVRIFAPWALTVGDRVTIGDRVTVYNVGAIEICSDVCVSQNAHLCAGSHDYRRSDMRLMRMPVRIEPNSWICADAFVGPGVTVGRNAIVGARSAVFRDVKPDSIVGGNPAVFLKKRWGDDESAAIQRKAA
ncbi:MAG: hypothetical protein R3C49_10995 [Planctomycetaceae bacterium]